MPVYLLNRNLYLTQKRYSDPTVNQDNIARVQGEIDEIKDIMVKNIGNIS